MTYPWPDANATGEADSSVRTGQSWHKRNRVSGWCLRTRESALSCLPRHTTTQQADISGNRRRGIDWPRNGIGGALKKMSGNMCKLAPLARKSEGANAKALGLLSLIPAEYPGQILTLDFVSKFASAVGSSHQQCLVLVDKFSRFVFLQGCHLTVTAQETAEIFLRQVISILGVPSKVILDRGPQFTSALWQQLLNLLGAKVSLAASHHPQSDGQSERAIQTVVQMLRKFTHAYKERWERLLPLFEVAINTATNATTGMTPAMILLGRHPRMPLQMAAEEENQHAEGDHDRKEKSDDGRLGSNVARGSWTRCGNWLYPSNDKPMKGTLPTTMRGGSRWSFSQAIGCSSP